jgi:hypothetical protein
METPVPTTGRRIRPAKIPFIWICPTAPYGENPLASSFFDYVRPHFPGLQLKIKVEAQFPTIVLLGGTSPRENWPRNIPLIRDVLEWTVCGQMKQDLRLDVKRTEALIEEIYGVSMERHLNKYINFILMMRPAPERELIKLIRHSYQIKVEIKLIPPPFPRSKDAEEWLPWATGWDAKNLWMSLNPNPRPYQYEASPFRLTRGEEKKRRRLRSQGYSTGKSQTTKDLPEESTSSSENLNNNVWGMTQEQVELAWATPLEI